MKRKLFKILPIVFLGGILGISSFGEIQRVSEIKAEDSNSVSFTTFADKGSSNGGSGKSISFVNNDVTVSTNGGYSTNGVLRVYSSKKLTISSKNYKIGSIAFVMDESDSKKYYDETLAKGISGVDQLTWSYTASKQLRFKSITVTFALSDSTVSSIAVDSSSIPSSIESGKPLSYSGIKINGTFSDESVYNIAEKCEFSPEEGTVLSQVGPQVVTVTYKSSNTPTTTSGEDLTTSFTISVTQGEKPTVYSKVTKNSDLSVGDKIIFVNDGAKKAAKGTLTTNSTAYKRYLDTTDITISDSKANISSNNEVGVYTVEAGSIANTYSFKNSSGKYLSTYAIDKDGLKFVDAKDAASSWTVDLGASSLNIKSNIANQAYDSCVYLRYNVNTFRAYKATSGVSETSIYKYSSGAEKINVPATASVIEGSSITVSSEVKGFTPSSYSWSTGDGSIIEIIGSSTGSSVQVKGLTPGSTTLSVKANNSNDLVATCVVTVIAKKDAVIENGEYFITDFAGSHVLNVDLDDITAPDYTDTTSMWSITNNGLDGDTYTISNGSKYLIHNPSIKNSSLDLTNNSSTYWTVTKNDDESYTFAFSETGNTLSCNPGASTGTWFAYSGATGTQDHVKLMKVGNYTGFEVEKLPTYKEYFVGDTLKPLNSKVNALFDNGAKVDITKNIVWEPLTHGTKAYGKVTIGGQVRDVVMDGIKVYKGDASTFVIEGLSDTYSVGEKINKDYLKVSITYKLSGEADIKKTLTKDDYVISPERIEEDTTKIRISLAKDPTVYYEKEIEVKASPYVATNYVGVGDRIVIGTLGYDPYDLTGGTELAYTDKFYYSTFGSLPRGEMVFEVGKENGYYTLKDTETGYYLKGDNSAFTFNKPDTKSVYAEGDGHYEFNVPVTIGGQSHIVTMKTTNSPDFSYANAFSSMDYINEYTDYIFGISDLANKKLNFILYTEADDYKGTQTAEVSLAYWSFESGVFQYALETSSALPEECLFTMNYDEDNEQWDISSKPHQDKELYFNKDGKFGFYAIGSSYTPIMLFRDNDLPLQSEVQSLSVSFQEGMNEVTVGEQFPWTSALIVKAHYAGGASKIVPVGGYEITQMPDTSKIGTATGVISYGQNDHKITKEFTITVKGKTQAFDVVCKDPILVGETYQAHLDNKYVPPVDEPIKWSVSDPTLASIDQDGNVTGLAPGYVDIIATSYDGTYSNSEHIRIYQQVESVTLDKHEAEINAGETVQLSATVLPENASNTKVTYSSSDSNVALVDENTGLVTGVKPGIATITCAAQNHPEENFDTCVITVKEAPVVHVTGITLDCDYKEIEVKDTFKLNAIITPEDAAVKNVTWSSSNEKIATVDQNGNVKGVAKGECVITATTADGGLTASCTIKVKASATNVPVTSVSVSQTSANLNVGEKVTVVATVAPGNADNKNVMWSTSDETVAIVNNGVISAIGEGQAVIKVTTIDGGFTAEVHVTVTAKHVTEIKLNQDDFSMVVGDSKQLTYSISPAEFADSGVRFSSSSEDVVVVDSQGNVYAIGEGEATVTITSLESGKTDSVKITVSKASQEEPAKKESFFVRLFKKIINFFKNLFKRK